MWHKFYLIFSNHADINLSTRLRTGTIRYGICTWIPPPPATEPEVSQVGKILDDLITSPIQIHNISDDPNDLGTIDLTILANNDTADPTPPNIGNKDNPPPPPPPLSPHKGPARPNIQDTTQVDRENDKSHPQNVSMTDLTDSLIIRLTTAMSQWPTTMSQCPTYRPQPAQINPGPNHTLRKLANLLETPLPPYQAAPTRISTGAVIPIEIKLGRNILNPPRQMNTVQAKDLHTAKVLWRPIIYWTAKTPFWLCCTKDQP